MSKDTKDNKLVKSLVKKGYNTLNSHSSLPEDEKAAWLVALFTLRALEHLNKNCSDSRLNLPVTTELKEIIQQRGNITEALEKALHQIESSEPKLAGVFSDQLLVHTKVNKSQLPHDESIFRDLVQQFDWFSFRTSASSIFLNISKDFQTFLNEIMNYLPITAGTFASPAELAELMAKIISPKPSSTIYDPVCGTGGLLAAAERHIRNISPKMKGSSTYGQDISPFATGVARLNLFFLDGHNQITTGDTLLKQPSLARAPFGNFDYVMANPPFGIRVDTRNLQESHPDYSMPTELAFLQHMISATGPRGEIITLMPNGILSRGGKSKILRKRMLHDGLIKAVIALPSQMFYGTTIPACLLLLDKNKSVDAPILFVDASQEFIEKKPRRELSDQGMGKIVSICKKPENIRGFSAIVSLKTIEANDFDLSVPRYITPNTDQPKLDFEFEFNKLHDLIREQDQLLVEMDKRRKTT